MAVDFTVAITASQLSFLLKVVIDLAGYRSKSSLIQVTIGRKYHIYFIMFISPLLLLQLSSSKQFLVSINA